MHIISERTVAAKLNGLAMRTILARHGLAVLFVGAAVVLTVWIQRISARAYFFLFIPAVIFASWYGGWSAGLLASILTVVLFATVLLPPDAVGDQLVWLLAAAIVTIATSFLTTHRRRQEEKLVARAAEERARRVEAEAISQLKTELLAQVGHELRQPVAAIVTALRLLDEPRAVSGRERTLNIARRQTEHLRQLVDDLLDLSRLNRRDLELEKTAVNLAEVVEESLHICQTQVADRGIQLSSALPCEPVIVAADPTRVRQIVSNLLSNAVKFTPAGGTITLALEQHPSGVSIRVRDTGRGIAADQIQHIFEMFHKAEAGGPGLGIGLAVVKGLVEMHGGSVAARSDGPGQGSEFIVTLPTEFQQSVA